jgi:hypothetical protein
VSPRWTIGRDLASWAVALAGIVHQEWTGRAQPALLALYGVLLGVPAGAAARRRLRSRRSTTGSSS